MVGRVKSIATELNELQSLLIARTSGKRCTSALKFASSGEVLSLFHASASGNGMFRSATDRMTTLSGQLLDVDRESEGLTAQIEELKRKICGVELNKTALETTESLLTRLRWRLDESLTWEQKRHLVECS